MSPPEAVFRPGYEDNLADRGCKRHAPGDSVRRTVPLCSLPIAERTLMRLAGCRWMPCVALSLLLTGAMAASAPAATRAAAVKTYVVDNVRTSLDRSAVVATGAAIVEVDHASVIVTAAPSDL